MKNRYVFLNSILVNPVRDFAYITISSTPQNTGYSILGMEILKVANTILLSIYDDSYKIKL